MLLAYARNLQKNLLAMEFSAFVWITLRYLNTDPCWLNKSFWSVNSSASTPASSSNSIEFGVPSITASTSSSMNSAVKLFQSLSSASDGIGLRRPTELAFELARWRKSGDNWKFPLWF